MFNASFIELPGRVIWTPDLQLFNYVSEIKFELCEVIFTLKPTGEINAKLGLYEPIYPGCLTGLFES